MPDTPAIPAATLILVRDGADGPPDLLMVERAATMAFAAGAMVFPGGRVDADDRLLGAQVRGPHGAARVAAVRETLEETAVPVGLDPIPSPDLARTLQQALLAEAPFSELLASHGLRLDVGDLILFAHWLPKFHASRRFDTLFFIDMAPPGAWHPTVGERENASAEWLSAAEALRRDAAGEASLIFPTRCTLQRLAQHGGFAAMRGDAARHPVETITPWIEEVDGEKMLAIPDHLGFPVTRAPLDRLSRG